MRRSVLGLVSLAACSAGTPTVITPPPPPSPSPRPAAVEVFAGDAQQGTPGYRLAMQVAVKVVDVTGNAVTGDTVTFRPTDPTGVAEPATAITDSTGIARTFWRLGGSLGTQLLSVTAPAIASATFTATATTRAVLAIDGGSLGFYHPTTGAMCAVDLNNVLGCWALPYPGRADPPAHFAPIQTAERFTGIAMIGNEPITMPNACALSTTGALWCFSLDSMATVKGFAQLAGTYPAFTSIASSGFLGQSFCALTASGAAWCWGWNGSAGLGDGTFFSRTTPGPVATTTQFTQIAPGDSGGCALAIDGTAWCWGSNGAYQAGTTAIDISAGCICVRFPTQVASTITFSRLINGSKNSAYCGIATTGGLYCWGHLFGPKFSNDKSPVPTAQFVGTSPVVDAAAPTYVMMALGQDGTITTNSYDVGFLSPPHISGVLRGFLSRNGSDWACGQARVGSGTLCMSDPTYAVSSIIGVPVQ